MDIVFLASIALLGFGLGGASGWYFLQSKLSSAHERAGKAEGEAASFGRQLASATEALEKSRRTAEEQVGRVARGEAERDGAVRERDVHAAQAALARKDLEDATGALRALQEERTNLRERNGALELLNARKDEELQTQKKWIEEQTAHLQALFSKTASDLLEDKAVRFGNANKDQIEALMKPLHLQLSEFRKRVDEVHSADTTSSAKLESQIAILAQKAADVGTTAANLANAMLGNSKKQGDWGEHQLVTLLEQAGFVKGRHFDTQVGARDDNADRRYADVVLWLPENRCLVLDSKLSLPSWTTYCSTEDPKIRESSLAAMVRSMRDHFESLAAIDYTQIIGKEKSIPFTLMFIPIEAAGIEAFKALPELFVNAQRRKVIMITPTTLFCVLQLVLGLWSIHDRHINSQQIAEQGRLLLRKLGTFLNSFKTVGDRLSAAMATYETAKGQLQVGPGNLVSVADRMTKLGVEAPKEGELAKLIQLSPVILDDPQLVEDHLDKQGSSTTVA